MPVTHPPQGEQPESLSHDEILAELTGNTGRGASANAPTGPLTDALIPLLTPLISELLKRLLTKFNILPKS